MHGRNNKTLEVVRELGFENVIRTSGQSTERVYFLGPCAGSCGREDGAHATVEAVLDFIAFWENQVQVAKDYLANGRNHAYPVDDHQYSYRERSMSEKDTELRIIRSKELIKKSEEQQKREFSRRISVLEKSIGQLFDRVEALEKVNGC